MISILNWRIYHAENKLWVNWKLIKHRKSSGSKLLVANHLYKLQKDYSSCDFAVLSWLNYLKQILHTRYYDTKLRPVIVWYTPIVVPFRILKKYKRVTSREKLSYWN